MIVCVGEILADMMGVTENGVTTYEQKAGGAPFNVSCAIKKLGGDVRFVGAVGDDLVGKFLIDYASDLGLSDNILVRNDANTTLAFVAHDESGERSFCFYRQNTADYMLGDVDEKLVDNASIIHIGSLMLGKEVGRTYAHNLAQKAKELGKIISFDVNYRSDIFASESQAVSIFKQMIEYADIVKFSQEEVQIFGEDYVNSLKDKLVLITLGKDGSKWFISGKSGSAQSISVSVVDTTGAGDAFYGAVLTKLDTTYPVVFDKTGVKDNEKMNEILRFANVVGALATKKKGAIDSLPSVEEVNNLL